MKSKEIYPIKPVSDEHLAWRAAGVRLAEPNLSLDRIKAILSEMHTGPKPSAEKIGAVAGLETKKDFIKPSTLVRH